MQRKLIAAGKDVDEPSATALAGLPAAANMRREVAAYVAWSTKTPHGLRTATEDVDAVLRRNRMEVLRTVATMRACEEEFSSPATSRLSQSSAQDAAHLSHCGLRKALYPRRATAHFKTMEDLTSSSPAHAPHEHRPSRIALHDASVPSPAPQAAGDGTIVRSDPRGAIAEKHRACVEVMKAQIPPGTERLLQNHTRTLGAVKPYGLSRPQRQDGSRRVADSAVDSNAQYVDRMQCCRPSKGLYVYYD
ncbi:MAG TPA: hypothetical protein ACHBY4_10055 [Arsenophonus apicola]|jgi:hypothetical protein